MNIDSITNGIVIDHIQAKKGLEIYNALIKNNLAEEKDGIYYCISKPLPVEKMHEMGHHRKEKGKEMFFAALAE